MKRNGNDVYDHCPQDSRTSSIAMMTTMMSMSMIKFAVKRVVAAVSMVVVVVGMSIIQKYWMGRPIRLGEYCLKGVLCMYSV